MRATAQRERQHRDVQRLYRRFTELQQATDEHAKLLSTSLDGTSTSLALVKAQLGSLLATATEDDEEHLA